MPNITVGPDRASSNSQLTLSEVAAARPKRGNGALERCASHKSAILALFRERGSQGLLGSELYSSAEKFGRSPRNRISELRRDGRLIEAKSHRSSDWFYRLISDKTGEKPLPTSLGSHNSDYGVRLISEPQLDAGPLFAAVSRD